MDPVVKAATVEVAKLELKPSDFLVIKLKDRIDEETRAALTEVLRRFRGDHGRVLVLDNGSDLAVITPTDA